MFAHNLHLQLLVVLICVSPYQNVHKVGLSQNELDAFYQSTMFEDNGVQK